ncbi:MAG: hypothetical protein ABR978_01385 [Dehalococcoidia bacterium]|jgi:hypothetical protein
MVYPMDPDLPPEDDGLEEAVELVTEEIDPPPPMAEGSDPPMPAADENLPDAMAAWTEALRSVQRSIDGAAEAIRFLRGTIQQMAPLLQSLGGLEDALQGFSGRDTRPTPATPEGVEEAGPPSPPEQIGGDLPDHVIPLTQRIVQEAHSEQGWQTWRRKPTTRDKPAPWEEADETPVMPVGPPRATLKPVTLIPDETPAPYAYKVTVEDRKSPIELVQLHQAFSSIPAVRNLSLLNYLNGVASIALETTEEIEPPEFESAIRKTMKRNCSVLPHESNTILIQVGE